MIDGPIGAGEDRKTFMKSLPKVKSWIFSILYTHIKCANFAQALNSAIQGPVFDIGQNFASLRNDAYELNCMLCIESVVFTLYGGWNIMVGTKKREVDSTSVSRFCVVFRCENMIQSTDTLEQQNVLVTVALHP